jgi:hypothetical protein
MDVAYRRIDPPSMKLTKHSQFARQRGFFNAIRQQRNFDAPGKIPLCRCSIPALTLIVIELFSFAKRLPYKLTPFLAA